MRTQEISDMWEEDCQVSGTDLGGAALSSPRLHSKYYRMYMQEKTLLHQYTNAMKLLRLEKYEMYTMGPDSDVAEAGKWKQRTLPDQGKILKAEVAKYIEADLDIMNLDQRYNDQLDKVKFIEAIIGAIKDRGYAIRNAIDMRKFEMGA